jgi:hypothetical protein
MEDCLIRAFSFKPVVEGSFTGGTGATGGVTLLSELTDVTIGTPEDGQVLTWDATLQK